MSAARLAALLLLAAGCGPGGPAPDETPAPKPVVLEEADDLEELTRTLLKRCGEDPLHVHAYRWEDGRISGTLTLAGEDGAPDERPLMPRAHDFKSPLTEASGYLVAVVYRPESSGGAGEEREYPVEVFGEANSASGAGGTGRTFRPVRGVVRVPRSSFGVTESLRTERRFAERTLRLGDRGPPDSPGWLAFRIDALEPAGPAGEG